MMNAPASTPRGLPVPSTQSSRHVAAHQDNLVPAYSARPADCPSEAQYQDQPQSTAPGPGNTTPRAKISGIKAASGKSISHGSGSPAKKKKDRSVSTLTPTQLQRKRESDRMYQKTARQRIQDRINSLAEEVRSLKIRHSHDTETIRELRQRNQVLEKEVQGQERLWINDSETMGQLRLRNQGLGSGFAPLFVGLGTPSPAGAGATIGRASSADTSDGELGFCSIGISPLPPYGGELGGAAAGFGV